MRVICIFTLVTSFSLFYSCNNNKTDNLSTVDTTTTAKSETSVKPLSYEIVKTEPYETGSKAQVKAYAYFRSDTVTKDNLEATLNDIYSTLKSYNNFKSFSFPTVIAVYLYTSKDKANNMQEAWIGMLSKTPSDIEPRLSIDDMKLTALSGQNDNAKSKNEKKYEELSAYFKKRNTDLCTIYKTLYDLEGESIKQADIKYPDFGTEHAAYSTKWYKAEKAKVFKKYKIQDSLSARITVFGMSYCK
jgi:hypothetical protein